MFTVGCGELFDVLTKEARSLFLEVPLHGRRAHVTGFEASQKRKKEAEGEVGRFGKRAHAAECCRLISWPIW